MAYDVSLGGRTGRVLEGHQFKCVFRIGDAQVIGYQAEHSLPVGFFDLVKEQNDGGTIGTVKDEKLIRCMELEIERVLAARPINHGRKIRVKYEGVSGKGHVYSFRVRFYNRPEPEKQLALLESNPAQVEKSGESEKSDLSQWVFENIFRHDPNGYE